VLDGHNPLMSFELCEISLAVSGPMGCSTSAFFPPMKGRETGTCSVDIVAVKWGGIREKREKRLGRFGVREAECLLYMRQRSH